MNEHLQEAETKMKLKQHEIVQLNERWQFERQFSVSPDAQTVDFELMKKKNVNKCTMKINLTENSTYHIDKIYAVVGIFIFMHSSTKYNNNVSDGNCADTHYK